MDYIKSNYDISNWEFDFTFLTDEEIKSARKYLANYMWAQFKCYDEEVIQKTILRALNQSHSYDPTKSGKLTWMSIILRNIFLQRNNPSNVRRKSLSLDDKVGGDIDRNWTDYIVDRGDDEEDDNLSDIAKELKWIIENGKYPLIKMRLDGLSYQDIADDLGVELWKVKGGIYRERTLLKRHLNKYGDDMMKAHLKTRTRDGKHKKG